MTRLLLIALLGCSLPASADDLRVGAAAAAVEADDSMVIAGGIGPAKAVGQEQLAARVQLVIGDQDLETWEITLSPDSRYWMDGGNDAGRTRIDRLCALRDNFAEHGIAARFDRVPGVSHNGYAVLDPVHAFFAEILARQRMPETE